MAKLTRSCRRLSARAIAHPDVVLAFDKDDDDTLDFVLATANLRAIAYGIANKTRFQVKGKLVTRAVQSS
jgi:ubiquitin-like 1-activating enzyme E1 B